jgi:hypothetical protein
MRTPRFGYSYNAGSEKNKRLEKVLVKFGGKFSRFIDWALESAEDIINKKEK